MPIFIDPRFEDLYRSDPLVLVDVGARGGLKADWQPAARHLQVVGFEPDARELERLRARAVPGGPLLFGVALHNRPGPVTFQLARDRGLSSVFEPNRPFVDRFPDAARFDITERVSVEATTLDELVAGAPEIRDVDFLKVDTQGSELFVLEGAARTLRGRVSGVEAEVEFNPIYKDQPLFADVDAALRQAGFQLFDIRPVYWKRAAGQELGGPRGQLIWGDTLYLKTLDGLRETLAVSPPERRKAKLLKAISIAMLYGYHDYAVEIAQGVDGVLDAAEQALVQQSLRRSGNRGGSAWPGQRAFAALMHRLWRGSLPRDRGAWSISRGRLGNRD